MDKEGLSSINLLGTAVDNTHLLDDWAKIFSESKDMGDQADYTSDDLSKLSVAIAANAEGALRSEEIGVGFQIDKKQILNSARGFYARVVLTVARYIENSEKEKTVLEYIDNVGEVVMLIDDTLRLLGLESESAMLLSEYGYGSNNYIDFRIRTKNYYSKKIEEKSRNGREERHSIPSEASLVDPVDFVRDLQSKEVDGSRTPTHLGLGNIPPRQAPERIVVTGSTRLIPSNRPPQQSKDVRPHQKTESGMGRTLISEDNPALGAIRTMGGVPVAPRPEIQMPESPKLPEIDDEPTIATFLDDGESDPIAFRPAVDVELVPAASGESGEAPPSGTFALPYGAELPSSGRSFTVQNATPETPDSRDSQPAIEMTLIAQSDLGELPDEHTQVSEGPGIPTMPPAPASRPPSAQLEKSSVDAQSVPTGPFVTTDRPAEAHEVLISPDQQPAIELPVAGQGMSLDYDMPEFTPPSAYRPGVSAPTRPKSNPPAATLEPAPLPQEPAPFTREWAEKKQQAAQQEEDAPDSEQGRRTTELPAMQPIMPEQESPSSTYLRQSLSNGHAVKIEQTPHDLPEKPAARKKAAKKRSSEEMTVVSRRPEAPTPGNVQKGTHSKIWRWAGAIAAAAGVAGLFGAVMHNSCNDQGTDSTEKQANATSSSDASVEAPSSSVAANKTPLQPNIVENQIKSERGIFRINAASPAFQGYLCHFKGATLLASTMKSVALATQVSFNTDPSERQSAERQGKTVLFGNENEKDQRMALMAAYLNQAKQDPTDNYFVKSYFQHQQSGFENFKKTGSWSEEAKSYGVDKLYNAIGTPEKLATSANIIGYAPVASESANPAWSKVREGVPAFASISEEAARRMHLPSNVVPYDDPRLVKEGTCRQIKLLIHDKPALRAMKIGELKDVMAGGQYMYNSWCIPSACAPENYLDQALRRTEPVYAEKPQVKPSPAPAPVNKSEIAPDPAPVPDNIAPATQPAPQHSWFKWPWKKHNTGCDQVLPKTEDTQMAKTTPEKKQGFFSRTAAQVKSFFGWEKKEAHQASAATQMAAIQDSAATTLSSAEPEFTRKDIPMYSWTETLKQYFWG